MIDGYCVGGARRRKHRLQRMVTFNLFVDPPDLAGQKLVPDMTRPADRYLDTDWRDSSW